MILDVFYNDIKLTDYFMVRRIVPSLSASVKPLFVDTKLKDTSMDMLKLEIELTIKDNIRHNLDELNRILQSKMLKPLVISDQPDRQLMCVMDGTIELTSRFQGGDGVLTFISPYPYWLSVDGEKIYEFDDTGIVEVDNEGTAPTPVELELDFKGNTHQVSIVSPDGYLLLGNEEEPSKEEEPKSKHVVNNNMSSVATTMTQVTNMETIAPDYKKISSQGSAKQNSNNISTDSSVERLPGHYWNGHAYLQNFTEEAHDFDLDSVVSVYDTTNLKTKTAAMMIIVLDNNNTPIMTTSLWNESSTHNDINISFKVNSANESGKNDSKIIYTNKIDGIYQGNVKMSKSGDNFKWEIASKETSMASIHGGEIINIGDTVYLKDTASHYYHANGTRVKVAGFTRGKPFTVKHIRTKSGVLQYACYQGSQEMFWAIQRDLTTSRSRISEPFKKIGANNIQFSLSNADLAKLKPSKVLVWQAIWDKTLPMTYNQIHSIRVTKHPSANHKERTNTFMEGDKLFIDGSSGEILLNNSKYTANFDVASRFFELEWGKTQLQIVPDEGAVMPDAKVRFEERYY